MPVPLLKGPPAKGIPSGYFPVAATDRVQRDHPARNGGEQTPGRDASAGAGGGRPRSGDVVCVRVRGDSETLWTGLARDRTRPIIIATRYGFHGKKGLAGAVTGTEPDAERDPRVRFISFPMGECRTSPIAARRSIRRRIARSWTRCQAVRPQARRPDHRAVPGRRRLVFHPPRRTCKCCSSSVARTTSCSSSTKCSRTSAAPGRLFAFETYGLEPDIVVLGKGLGNGVPVAAAVGRTDLFAALDYGEGSDTWSANPLCCAAVLATLDEFETRDVLGGSASAPP